jgi:VIT1/CCC1 family predicted Fe2+/Mn2+ transporter
VAGVVGAELSTRVVLILGIANLLADGFSMAAANFSGTKTEIEEYSTIRHMEERHIEADPAGEREEIRQIFAAKGFQGEALDRAVRIITESRELWIDTMMSEEHGLPPVNRSPVRAATATFIAFLVCGFVPLLPFAFGLPATVETSVAMTGITFFTIGSLRSHWSPKSWWRAGAETFAIGMGAATVAFLAGYVLRGLV